MIFAIITLAVAVLACGIFLWSTYVCPRQDVTLKLRRLSNISYLICCFSVYGIFRYILKMGLSLSLTISVAVVIVTFCIGKKLKKGE